MKHYFFAAIMLLVAVSATAQLLVRPNGTVRIGECDPEDSGSLAEEYRDTVSALQVYTQTGRDQSYARITFGLQTASPLQTAVGRHTFSLYNNHYIPGDQIWLHGRNGFLFTRGTAAGDTIAQYVSNGSYVGFNCPVKSEGVLLTSDERCKEDVRDMEGSLETLAGLRGVTYHLKPRPFPEAGLQVPNEEARKYYEQFETEYAAEEAARCGRLRYGFLAQELEQVLPDLVQTDENGMKSVDYIAIIPILVNAVNELSGELEAVKARNSELESQSGAAAVNYAPVQQPTGVDALLAGRTAEVLGQNDPNPFSADTRIAYNLPDGTQTAAIYIYDLQGKQVMQLPVTEPGAGSVTLHGGNLQAGMYIYSLIADGKELASKKMILTK